MEKALTRVGNSFALIIDKPLCKLIGIGYGSIVKLTSDGTRIMIERTGRVSAPHASKQNRVAVDEPSEREPTLKRVSFVEELEYDSLACLEADGFDIVQDLLKAGLNHPRMDRLHHLTGQRGPTYVFRVESMIKAGLANAPAQDLQTLRRMRNVLERLEAGFHWDDAIPRALELFPLLPSL